MSDCDGVDVPQDGSLTRQQRLLTSRNARFPAKKLSLSTISSKLTQIAGPDPNRTNESNTANTLPRRQENRLVKSRSTGTVGRRSGIYSFNILGEISNTTRHRPLRSSEIPIFEDDPHRPLLEESSPSPWGSSPALDNTKHEFSSPEVFDPIRRDLGMQLRELSINASRSTSVSQNSLQSFSEQKRRRARTAFDADEYIEHIEKELQTARDEAYSPLTKQPMKEKLRMANWQIERLQQELVQSREQFEAEVKRAVEHKTATEVELRRKIKELENRLDEKDRTIEELQSQHETKRLDTSIIETMKATIDRLELEKQDMEEFNLSMTRRNEALAQLLAMSPTKLNEGFDLRSPVRGKRPARPMSLIIPRLPASPNADYTQPSSLITSPRGLCISGAGISPLKLSPGEESSDELLTSCSAKRVAGNLSQPVSAGIGPPSPLFSDKLQRRWTTKRMSMHSRGMSVNSTDDTGTAAANKRKPRRFVAGSTQLKPLLLPAFSSVSDNVSMSGLSAASSPRSVVVPSEYASDGDSAADTTTVDVDATPATPSWGDRAEKQIDSYFNLGESPLERNLQHSKEDCELDMLANPLLVEMQEYESLHITSSPPLFEPQHAKVELPRPLFSAADESVAAVPAPSPSLNHRKRRGLASPLETSVDSPRAKALKCAPSVRSTSMPSDEPITLPPTTSRGSQITTSCKRMSQIRSADNFVDFLRQKDLAAKPLATMTIKTIYTIVSSFARSAEEFRQDPFALARRVIANAWYMNWAMFGKLSWYVLGLFIQPPGTKGKAPIDWDSYDGESIASRYCSSESDRSEYSGRRCRTTSVCARDAQRPSSMISQHEQAGWVKSLLLWGKFSAALMLAVGGAVIKGPAAMLQEEQKGRHKRRKNRQYRRRSQIQQSFFEPPTRDEFCFRSEMELPLITTVGNSFHDYNATYRSRPFASVDVVETVPRTSTACHKPLSPYHERLHQSFLDTNSDGDDEDDNDEHEDVDGREGHDEHTEPWLGSPGPSLASLQEGSIHDSEYYRDTTPSTISGDFEQDNNQG